MDDDLKMSECYTTNLKFIKTIHASVLKQKYFSADNYAKIMTWSLHYHEEIDANQIHSFYGKFVKLPVQRKF